MICPYCNNQISDQINYCTHCGADIKTYIQSQVQTVVNYTNTTEYNQISQNSQNQDNNTKIKPKKRKIGLIITLSIILLAVIGVTTYFVVDSKRVPPPECEGVVIEPVKYSTYQKLKTDYDKGNIDVNTYFTQLVYCEYDTEKLDEKYKSDVDTFTISNNDEIMYLIENYRDKLDKDILKFYIENITLQNVVLGEKESDSQIKKQSHNNKRYEIKLMSNEDEWNTYTQNAANHHLDKVCLSRNDNFLIWYTDTGEDAITEQQLKDISNGLEDTIREYEKIFGVEYTYTPLTDSVFGKDYKNATILLEENGMSVSQIKESMSVYIYNSGENNSAASYTVVDPAWYKEVLLYLGADKNNAIVTYPYIHINKNSFSTENESLKQLYRHELFHHFQYIFGQSTIGKPCSINDNYSDATANLASALTCDAKTQNSFLNGWADIYTRNTETKLSEITDGASLGYGVFPYFYVYSQEVDNWAETLMYAHNETDSYKYVFDNTSKEDLAKVSKTLAYKTIAKKFGNNALYSSKEVTIKSKINTPKQIDETINAGSIIYYEISGDLAIDVIGGNKDYVGMSIYGYKNGFFKELSSDMGKLEFDLTSYKKYERFYLAIYNANIVESNTYSITAKESEFAENLEFDTTFNNYNIEIDLYMTVAGIKTHTVSVGTIDELHQKEYLKVSTDMDGLTMDTYTYHDFYSGYTYMTQPLDSDAWYKEQSYPQMIDLGIILDKLNSMEDVTKVDDNHFKVKMSRREVKNLMSSTNSDTTAIKGSVLIDVYTKNGHISKLEYDFSDMVYGIDALTTTIKFSNYNKAGDVKIPMDIIEDASDEILPVPTDLESWFTFFDNNQNFFEKIINSLE